MTISAPRKVIVIGLDGATLDLIRPWAEAGALPTFRKLMDSGSWGTLRTIIPPITPTAWSSFLTGVNPGKHGLFDFQGRKKDSYQTYLTNATHRTGPSLWQLAGQAGYQVAIYNVPITYPPEKVNGVMISGLQTPANATDASWPPELQQEAKQAIPEMNFSPPGMHSRGPEQDVTFVREVRELNKTTLAVTKYLMHRQPWDLFVSIFMGTDIMGHFMWRHMETKGMEAPEPVREILANAIQDCYKDMDNAVAELINEAGEDTYVFIMSDHGFGPLESHFSVNAWLAQKGYMKFKRSPLSLMRRMLYNLGITPIRIYDLMISIGGGDTMRHAARRQSTFMQGLIKNMFLSFDDVEWSRTKAYSNGYAGPIFINQKGREPQGIVEPGAEYERVLDEMSADLRKMKEPGTDLPFVGEIYRGRSLYSGDHVDHAPDLLFMPRDMKYASLGTLAFPAKNWLIPSPDRTGHHRMDGILFAAGPGIRPGNQIHASIMDIMPTILALMGVPIPDRIDGKVLESIMTPELRRDVDIRYTHDDGGGTTADIVATPEMSEEEEELIRTRLKDLGYIG